MKNKNLLEIESFGDYGASMREAVITQLFRDDAQIYYMDEPLLSSVGPELIDIPPEAGDLVAVAIAG